TKRHTTPRTPTNTPGPQTPTPSPTSHQPPPQPQEHPAQHNDRPGHAEQQRQHRASRAAREGGKGARQRIEDESAAGAAARDRHRTEKHDLSPTPKQNKTPRPMHTHKPGGNSFRI